MCPGASAYTDTVHWLQIFQSCALPVFSGALLSLATHFMLVCHYTVLVTGKFVCMYIYICCSFSGGCFWFFLYTYGHDFKGQRQWTCLFKQQVLLLRNQLCSCTCFMKMYKIKYLNLQFTGMYEICGAGTYCWSCMAVCACSTRTLTQARSRARAHTHTHERLLKTFLIKKKWT